MQCYLQRATKPQGMVCAEQDATGNGKVFWKSGFLGYGNDVPRGHGYLIFDQMVSQQYVKQGLGLGGCPTPGSLAEGEACAGAQVSSAEEYALRFESVLLCQFYFFMKKHSDWGLFPFFVTNLGSDPIPTSAEKDPSAWLMLLSLYRLKVAVKHWNWTVNRMVILTQHLPVCHWDNTEVLQLNMKAPWSL